MLLELTNPGKTCRLKEKMNKGLIRTLIGAAAASLVMGGCAGPQAADQVKFGVWASRQNLWEEAVFRWKKALEENPGSAAAHNNLAVAYERKGLFDQAIKEYELALKLDPKNETVKSNLEKCKESLAPAKAAAEAKKSDEKK
ncbi:MAG: tetratricopeptide repeat protein [Candidatus Aminicenantes bacterium]|nr:tetratricopeptide repeat protein [Candidatus Aminicenantes bacterium]